MYVFREKFLGGAEYARTHTHSHKKNEVQQYMKTYEKVHIGSFLMKTLHHQ